MHKKKRMLTKTIIIFIISILPSNYLRVYLLNKFEGFNDLKKFGCFNFFIFKSIQIKKSYIGNFNFINSEKITIYKSKIGNLNNISKFKNIKINNKSIIGSRNFIKNSRFKSLLMNKSQISTNCYMESYGNLFIGKNVVFGGLNTKILNIDNNTENTVFKNNIFIGSNSNIKSGIKVSKDIIIGAGSYINTSLNNQGLYSTLNIYK